MRSAGEPERRGLRGGRPAAQRHGMSKTCCPASGHRFRRLARLEMPAPVARAAFGTIIAGPLVAFAA